MRVTPLLAGSVLTAICLVGITAALAQSSGGDFELKKSTIDAGGGAASGGSFELVGTFAQAEANPRQSSGGEFMLAGGFWASTSSAAGRIFSDGFEGD